MVGFTLDFLHVRCCNISWFIGRVLQTAHYSYWTQGFLLFAGELGGGKVACSW